MKFRSRNLIAALLAVGLAGTAAACGGSDSGGDADAATQARGEITVWLSNNKEEVAWGKQMVAAWNSAHADQKVTAQEIPTGKSSEEVIGAAITAGNAPCLIFNTSPASVPQFQKQGGLVALDSFSDGKQYIEDRSGKVAEQYKSTDGKYYQLPWKANPVMIFYNKKAFAKAGIDTAKPPLATYDEFLATSRKLVAAKAANFAIWPAPSNEFYQSWFDFYPLFAAETGGKQLVEGGKAQFASDEGKKVANFWRTVYAEKLASQEKYTADAFADGKAAMAIVGPWAIAVYKGKVEWGAVPVPTSAAKPASDIHTFSDAKNVAMYSACKNRGTAWDVLKFATSKEQDGKLLEVSGQMPIRNDVAGAYPEYFTKNPDYKSFADQAARTVEVPNVANSIEIWQTFRDAYSKSVIFGQQDPGAALDGAAQKVDQLAAQS
ncbi:multiple sugar transport system substrate-binding protein [Kribbella orskensis]|uniref:Multiple sugar transport system substrate-binding protein n=1 Tax=Kribbella orskensis TaxID=2512216 RepID=A0ABY2BV35_9ACTN|nr:MULTISPECIES: extracellular solute-binding protein [Kribbella]TCN44312.1 multiple sugar transport system substrate-binding protein [Kribbella sp. VKM Ac-2500]TCO31910.1 multiple sugar transport system substrate-binding protein [Kribbella orskensis]